MLFFCFVFFESSAQWRSDVYFLGRAKKKSSVMLHKYTELNLAQLRREKV
jgi:hypothetical protein